MNHDKRGIKQRWGRGGKYQLRGVVSGVVVPVVKPGSTGVSVTMATGVTGTVVADFRPKNC
ncbi:hypothetical protein V6667_04240 [Neisseria leonii]|uniref:Uncharacterized protein n=1 Tax=Neisseria leonii TaxID=2995413 RepID=A0A9X4ICS5_9NEIS|nr:hypothetical protein [Neisseria sp. 51.81]MDD9326936.1 hypothetical protein [Neisseria sp. 51.81]